MPHTTAVSSASAIVRPPNARSLVIDPAPSSPMPVIRTPIRRLGETCAMALSTNRSALGCHGRPASAGAEDDDQIAGDLRNDDVGVAAPDIGVAGLERRGARHLADADRAEAVQAAGERAGEIRGHVLSDDDGPRKSRRQGAEQRLQRRRPAGRGSDHHNSISRRPHGRLAGAANALAR